MGLAKGDLRTPATYHKILTNEQKLGSCGTSEGHVGTRGSSLEVLPRLSSVHAAQISTEKQGWHDGALCLQIEVTCTEDVLHVMDLGHRNRAVAETKMNERSSRSHSVLTIIVDGHSHVTGGRTHGCLHLIDLAGKAHITPQLGHVWIYFECCHQLV